MVFSFGVLTAHFLCFILRVLRLLDFVLRGYDLEDFEGSCPVCIPVHPVSWPYWCFALQSGDYQASKFGFGVHPVDHVSCHFGACTAIWIFKKRVLCNLILFGISSDLSCMAIVIRESRVKGSRSTDQRSGFVGAVVFVNFLILLYRFILKFDLEVSSHFCWFLEASKDFLFRLWQFLSGSTRAIAYRAVNSSFHGVVVFCAITTCDLGRDRSLVQMVMFFDHPIDECGDTVMDVQIWKFQSLVYQHVILCHLLVFLVLPHQSGYCPGFDKRGFSVSCMAISSDYLADLEFVRFALNCSLLSDHATIGYRTVNYSFHGVVVFVRLC
ncbi:hypothetical protein MTR67_001925 [Solanum verrucosum]|uniref:Uncharacterized protein n=1 Tax=Solanum verrucosum TaxID=315347 RepID=A0AAF0PRF3_SOLVR|nr:hypothetical protein MTR67_001925 [Solanum verrucosum]